MNSFGKSVLFGVLSLAMMGELGLIGCTRSGSPGSEPPLARGVDAAAQSPGAQSPGATRTYRRAPEFSLTDRQGKTQRLSSLKGRPVLVHFWASWCPPCLEELPQFLETVKDFEGKGLAFVAISLDKSWQEAEKVLPASAAPSGLLYLLDEAQKTAEDFGSYQFPETYLLDSQGQILEKWVGAQDWKGDSVRKRLAQLMGAARSAN